MDRAEMRVVALQIANHQAVTISNQKTLNKDDVLAHARAYETFLAGSDEENLSEDKLVEIAARAAHEAIRTLQIENNEPNVASPWETVGQDIKDSCFIGIKRVLVDPEISNEDLHNSWIETKKSQGWTFGEVRSEETKQHPCMVPYSELPAFQRLKDAMFRNVVKAVLGI